MLNKTYSGVEKTKKGTVASIKRRLWEVE
jgi:hypothetical protein